MFRTLAAVLLIACVAVAQDPPPKPILPAPPVAPPKPPGPPDLPAPPPMPGGMMTVSVVKVKVKDGGLVQQVTEMVPVQETVKVTEFVNGQPVIKDVAVTKYMMQTVEKVTKLKDVKATGTDGKAITGDDLEKKLKDGTSVVMTFGKLTDDQRKVFKDDTIFMEQFPGGRPGGPGGLPGGPGGLPGGPPRVDPVPPIGPKPPLPPKPPEEPKKEDPIKK